MKIKLSIHLVLAACLPLQAMGDIASKDIAYKWSDEQRHVHYSQVRPSFEFNISPFTVNRAATKPASPDAGNGAGGIAYKWNDPLRHVHYTQEMPSPGIGIDKVIIYNRNALVAKTVRDLELNGKLSTGVASPVADQDRKVRPPESGTAMANASDDLNTVLANEASHRGSPLDWYKSVAGEEADMTLMSLTGGFVAGEPENQASDGKSSAESRFIPPCLKLGEFIEGGQVQAYQCRDGQCANPQCTESKMLVGLRDRVRRVLIGSGFCADCAGGILRNLAGREGGKLGDDERQFIQSSSPEVRALLRKLAAQPDAMQLFSENMVDDIAIDMAHQIVDEVFEKARNAADAAGHALDAAAEAVQRDLALQINERERVASESIAATSTMIDFYSKAEAQIHPPGKPERGLLARQP